MKISPRQYSDFKKDFSFDALRGKTFGRSFCDHFGIADNLLWFTADPEWCDRYIQQQYLKFDRTAMPL